MTKKQVLIFLSLACLVAFLVWLYQQIEWVEHKTDLGPSAEIKRQEYIAAQRFLEEKGIKVNVEKGYTLLDDRDKNKAFAESSDQGQTIFPAQNDLIVIGDGYGSLSEQRAEKLLAWVKDGGNLIVTAENPFLGSVDDRSDRIFDAFDIFPVDHQPAEFTESEFEETFDDVKDLTQIEAAQESSQGEPAGEDSYERWKPTKFCSLLEDRLIFEVHNGVEIEVGLQADSALGFKEEHEQNFFFWVSSDRGIQIAQAYHGDGVITFLSDINLWKNGFIACYNNAYLLNFFTEKRESIWFLVNQDSPSLLSLIWSNFPFLVSLFFLSVCLCVWFFGQRFGQISRSELIDRRRIIEHIDAGSHFLWRNKESRWTLVLTVQNTIKNKMKFRSANFDLKTYEQQVDMISKATQLPSEQVSYAMFEITDEMRASTLTEQNFVSLITALKTIEDKL